MSRAFVIYLSVIVGLFVALFFWLAAWPANAQPLCGPRAEVINAIKGSAKETEIWFGKPAGNEPVVMLLLAGESGSWSLLIVKPDVACFIASGLGSTQMFGDPS